MEALQQYLKELTRWAVLKINESSFKCSSNPDESLQTSLIDIALLIEAMNGDKPAYHLQQTATGTEQLTRLLLALYLHKYRQNQYAVRPDALYKTGTVLLSPDYQARVVVGRHQNGAITRPVKQKHGETRRPTFRQLANCIPLAGIDEHSYTRNSVQNLRDYFTFLESNLTDFRALTRFNYRLAVVAPAGVVDKLREIGSFPIRQHGKPFDVPVVEPLIEIATSYADLRDQLMRDKTLDEVVLLGDASYANGTNTMRNDLGDGHIKRLVVVGTQPVPHDDFAVWRWSHTETALLQRGGTPDFNRISIADATADALRREAMAFAPMLEAVGLSSHKAEAALHRLCSQHVRDAWTDSNSLLDYQRDVLYTEWQQWFEEAGRTEAFVELRDCLMGVLGRLGQHTEDHRAKLLKIRELTDPRIQTYVVARRKQAGALAAALAGMPRTEAISYEELKRHLSEPAGKKPRQYVFPCLHLDFSATSASHRLRRYRLALQAHGHGQVHLLFAQGFEDGFLALCEHLHLTDESRSLMHPGRAAWRTGTTPPMLTTLTEQPAPTEACNTDDPIQFPPDLNTAAGMADYFARYFGVWKEKRPASRPRHTDSDHPNQAETRCLGDQRRFRIRMDMLDIEYNGSHPVARINPHTLQTEEVLVSQIQVGDFLLHFEINLYNCLEALHTVPDVGAVLDEIRWGANAWRQWLHKSIEVASLLKKCDTAEARQHRYQRIAERLRQQDPTDEFVELIRFGQWLDQPKKPFFPKEPRHLEAILDSHLGQLPEADRPAKQEEKRRILAASQQRRRFNEVISTLQEEMIRYRLGHGKGDWLKHMPSQHLEKIMSTEKHLEVSSTSEIQPLPHAYAA